MRRFGWQLAALLLLGTTPGFAAPPGKRAFFPPQTVGDASCVKKIVTGDFDADGRMDFATLAWETGNRCVIAGVEYKKGYLVRAYLNATPPGAAGPVFAPPIEIPYIDDAYRIHDIWESDIAAADVNRDGRDDLVVANAHADQVHAYLSTGTGFGPAVVSAAEDDPTYIAAGDFDADGQLDVALLHLRRNTLPRDYHWSFSFQFGDGSGSFRNPIVKDLGNWSFPNDRTPFYSSNSFQFAPAPGGVRLDGGRQPRDAVYTNSGGLKWLQGGAVASAGDEPHATFRRLPWSFSIALDSTGKGVREVAEAGGRTMFGAGALLGDILLSRYDETLDRVLLDGSGWRLPNFGQAVVYRDFDRDGVPDLAMLSDEQLADVPLHDGRSILLAYGDPGSTHPLSLKGTLGPVKTRLRFLEGSSGVWWAGHHAGYLASGDLNGDGYLDVLLNSAAGILAYTNVGELPYDDPVPRIEDASGIDPAGNYSTQSIRLFGTFEVSGYRVSSAYFTPVGRPEAPYNVLGTLDSGGRAFTVPIPPDNALPPGDYVLSVFNGIAESQRINPQVKIRLRPISISGVSVEPPRVGESSFPITVEGWFGNDAADRAKCKVKLLWVDPAGPPLPISLPMFQEGAIRFLKTVSGRHIYRVQVEHPDRGTAVSDSFTVDHTPRIDGAVWNNPDGTEGRTNVLLVVPMQPGAKVRVNGTLLRAPGIDSWRLLHGGMVFLSGTPDTVGGDNRFGSVEFTLPDTGDRSDVYLELLTQGGLLSNRLGPLQIKKDSGDPVNTYHFVIEPIGAACWRSLNCKAETSPGTSEADARSKLEKIYERFLACILITSYKGVVDPCDFRWKYQVDDGFGGSFEETVKTATEQGADALIRMKHPGKSFTLIERPK